MTDDAPRQPDGKFATGAGWTSEQAREAARKSHVPGVRKKASEADVEGLLQEAGVDPDTAPATLRVLAQNAVKGSSADMKLFLSQTGQLTGNEKYDGKGPCPTCGQTPGEGLTVQAGQIASLDHSVETLTKLVEESEALILREHGIDLHPVPYAPEEKKKP
jgi:hypothetical protein